MIWAYITLITIISSEREADASRENYRELEKGRERENQNLILNFVIAE